MNSDPYDSAAWRSFGILDADENALFAEAMRHDPGLRRACHEMDRLAAAIAAIASTPVTPQAEEVDRLRRSVGLPHAGRKAPLWVAVTGWAAALALAAWAVHGLFVSPAVETETADARIIPASPPAAAAAPPGDAVEIRRLTEEIGDLQARLEEFHQRDREFYQIVPGRSFQVVMKMLPPDATVNETSSQVTSAMIGDALAALHAPPPLAAEVEPLDPVAGESAEHAATLPELDPQPPGPPMAIPIYDAIRDTGTLVILNLLPAGEGNAYHLWVTTSQSPQPVFIGSLPDSSGNGADAFDFGLGSSMVLPMGFMLTHGPAADPSAPTTENIVLSGPPAR